MFGFSIYMKDYRNIFKALFCNPCMLKINKMTETIGKKVFTDSGDLFGMIEELNLVDNKIDGWRIVVSRDSDMSSLLGGARGIIVPHQFIKAIGDIVIINKGAVPIQGNSIDDDLPLDDEDLI